MWRTGRIDEDEGEDKICEVTSHSEAAVPTFGDKPIVSNVQRNKVVALSLAGSAASSELHGFVSMLKHHQKKAGGVINHNTNVVKNLAATQAFPGENVDEGSTPEPQAKKAMQPAKLVPGVPARGRGGAGARAGGGVFGSRAARQTAAMAAAAVDATRDKQGRRRDGPGRHRM
eukprot:jgi/Tetstr1/425719/TSEL_016139.t1